MLVLQRPVLPPRLPQRPRVVGEEILLGKNTRLARLVAVRGFWEIEDWPEDALRALLAQAYGPSEAVLQPLVKAVRAATTLLPRSLIQAANALQGLPEPQADADSRLTQAERLLKAGADPQTLATAMRREGLNLRPAPDWTERLALCDKGVVLGHGTVIVDLTDQPDGSTGLAVEGNEANILALLSVASGRLVSPDALNKLASASRSLGKGNVAQAAITLCHIGQPSLQDRDLAKMLTVAASCLGRGHRPGDVMKACGFTSTQLRKAYGNGIDQPDKLKKYNMLHYPAHSGHGGQFAPKDVTQMSSEEKAVELTKINDALDKAVLALHTYGDWKHLPPGYRQVTDPAELQKLGITPEDLSPPGSSLHAELFVKDGKYVLAFRGTRMGEENDIKNDVANGAGFPAEAYDKAKDLANNLFNHIGHNLSFTGHSLGGGLASAAAVSTGLPATTFNAAGIDSGAMTKPDVPLPQVDAYYVPGEILTTLQNNREAIIAAASAGGGAIVTGTVGLAEVTSAVTGRQYNQLLPRAYGTPIQLPLAQPPQVSNTTYSRHSMDWVINGLFARKDALVGH